MIGIVPRVRGGIRGMIGVALAIALLGPWTANAHAVVQHCSANSPTSVGAYKSVANGRNAQFGVGDITSMVRLPDGRRFFTFGDTGYYNVHKNGSAGPLLGWGNNSAWVQQGSCFTLLARFGPGSRSWVLPPQGGAAIYWPGASVVVGTRLYVFFVRLYLTSTFGHPISAAVAVFDLPSLQLARIVSIPFAPNRIFGQGAVYDDGYIYTYTAWKHSCTFCFSSDMYVARVRESQIQDSAAWRYRTATGWTANRADGRPVLVGAVSTVDVQPYGNGFLLLTKPMSIASPEVDAQFAPNPWGPWQDLGTVFTVPDPPPSYVDGYSYRSPYSYNPIALTSTRLTEGGVLAAYNVNSFDSSDGLVDGRMTGPRFFPLTIPSAPAAPARPVSKPGPSPWTPTFLLDRHGRVHTLAGTASLPSSHTRSAVAVARTPTGLGGWVAAANGALYTFGDAHNYGSMGGRHLNQPIVGMAATPTGHGYWLVARDGGIFTFGDATYHGSTGGLKLNQPIVAMTSTATGSGYWMVARDGGIFTFGDARYLGSAGGSHLQAPVVAMAAMPDARGYWLLTLGGQVYGYGEAQNMGNAPQTGFSTGIVATPGGYRVVNSGGHVYSFGALHGSSVMHVTEPIVAAG
jgi:hypothetical protein